ncbi:bifunctional nitrate reductase/sulfite reductase flavoprotein subunit alpha [Paenibacillus oryzisoli]|uniref:molybdopterin-dependent oxidoreductase n=1 Tax=Paenibacillus oryzisoli TaxID=1850517 RepID=UPI003D2BCABD
MTTTKVKSVCPYCGVGCGIILEVSGNRVTKVTGDKEHPTNFGRLCTKGSTCAQAIAASGRLEYACQRQHRNAEPARIGIDQAIRETAGKLRNILDQHGPDSVSFYVSGQMSLEAQYLINKLAKGFVRTNNIESNSRLCMASAGSGYKLSLGADGPPGSYQDMDAANLFFVIGANMADCHPILFLRVMDRIKAGAKLIVVDPRRNATAEKADLFLQIKPGTDLALLNGLLHLLLKNDHTDPAFIRDFTSGWDDMPAFLDDYPPDRVAAITGIPEKDIRLAAGWIGEAADWMSMWTMGLNQSTHGTWHTNAICNLHLATGAICRPGSGPFSLTGQPNAMGGREMGYMGPGLPGQRSVLVKEDRDFIEDMWRIPRGTLSTDTGSGTVSMFQQMASGNIKACWIICTNPVATVPNRQTVIAGLQAAELVVTQDAFYETETNRYADVMLPGALWSEAEGVMINSERNLTLMRRAVDPPGEALADWDIIARVACEMGYRDAFTYASAAEVYEEIQQAWNPKTGYDIRGATYARLQETPMQWPAAPDTAQHRNGIRYLNNGISQKLKANEDGTIPRLAFATESGKGIFLARPFLPPEEMPDEAFGFILNTGRVQHQWHTMTKTGKIPTLNKLNPGPFVEIHPEDAASLGIQDEDRVEIRSRRGFAILPAVVTDRVRPGGCFAPFHWNDVFGEHLAINEVTSDAVDPISFQPELKYCAVALTKAAAPLSTFPKEEGYMSKVDTLATILGIEPAAALTLETHEKMYLAGFITSLRTDDSRTSAGIPVLPLTAPLDLSKKYWLDGMLAGMFSRTYLPEAAAAVSVAAPLASPSASGGALPVAVAAAAVGSAAQPAASARTGITLLWASQTGNAEGAALECAKTLQAAAHDIRCIPMDAYNVAELASERFVILVASTFGAGDPPDNGAAFWQALGADNAIKLPELQYAVLGLGDSSYDAFCGFARNLDARLEQLGARRLTSRADCDTDYSERLGSWIQSVNQTLQAVKDGISAKGKSYDRQHPLQTTLKANHQLSGDGSEKDTRHYIFDLAGTGLTYEAGDSLGVWPVNCPELVAELLFVTGLQADAPVRIKDQELPLQDALLHRLEIARITPAALAFLHERSGSEQLGELLQPQHKARLRTWLWGRQLVDVLAELPVRLTAEELVGLLKPLQPRLYSISSSPKATPDEVHITVSTVRYTCSDRARKGVCSTYLAERLAPDAKTAIFVQKAAHFRPPADLEAPMIMVGPGTGVGPFRGFLLERQAAQAKGRNWLFFGEQHADTDFYFQAELEAMVSSGLLRLDTAFSRDQAEKVYVQHRMLEHGAELWAWLQAGAHFYICGDASAMAKEVEGALKTIIQTHGGKSAYEADAYVKEMAQSKRYAKDVY